MSKFNVGDIVKLKSGGPNMTVRATIDAAGLAKGMLGVDISSPNHIPNFEVTCEWFEDNKPMEKRYNENTLDLAD